MNTMTPEQERALFGRTTQEAVDSAVCVSCGRHVWEYLPTTVWERYKRTGLCGRCQKLAAKE